MDLGQIPTDQLLLAARSPVFEVRLRQSQILRVAGNDAYNSGNIEDAVKYYNRAAYHANFEDSKMSFEFTTAHRLQVFNTEYPLFLNLARCSLQLDQFRDTIRWTNKVLNSIEKEYIPSSVLAKVYFLRGKAHLRLDEFNDAEKDFEASFENNAEDKAVTQLLSQTRKCKVSHEKRFNRSWRTVLSRSTASTTWLSQSNTHPRNFNLGSIIAHYYILICISVFITVFFVILYCMS